MVNGFGFIMPVGRLLLPSHTLPVTSNDGWYIGIVLNSSFSIACWVADNTACGCRLVILVLIGVYWGLLRVISG